MQTRSMSRRAREQSLESTGETHSTTSNADTTSTTSHQDIEPSTPKPVKPRATRKPAGKSTPKAGTPTTDTPNDSSGSGKKMVLLPRPKPSAQYLEQVAKPSTILASPRKLLIVLDVNGVLGRKNRSGGIVPRPSASPFLRYVTSQHHVMIWSSARRDNVQKRCKILFDAAGIAIPKIVWDRSQFKLKPHMYNLDVQVYKRLTDVWSSQEVAETFPQETFDASNTVLIDDSIEKAASEPHNLIPVEEFVGKGGEVDELGRVVQYLETARQQSNVCAFIKERPYHQEQHSQDYDWSASILPELERGLTELQLSNNDNKTT